MFLAVKRFLMQIGNLSLMLLTEQILLSMLKILLKNQMRQKWKFFILKKKKIEEKEQMLIDDDEKRGNLSIEYSLMKIEYSLKVKTKFEWEQKKQKEVKKT